MSTWRWPVAVVLAGRGRTVYLQCFDASGAPMAAPRMLGGEEIASAIPSGVSRCAGDAAHLAAADSAVLPEGLPDPAEPQQSQTLALQGLVLHGGIYGRGLEHPLEGGQRRFKVAEVSHAVANA